MIEIMQSIRPEWCKKDFSGEKTVEFRKTRPKANPPYQVFVYETANGGGSGLVIGEYICDEVAKIGIDGVGPYLMNDGEAHYLPEIGWKTGMVNARRELIEYSGVFGVFTKLYGWHITRTVLYGIPKELSDFKHYEASGRGFFVPLERAPQSWCYVKGGWTNDHTD